MLAILRHQYLEVDVRNQDCHALQPMKEGCQYARGDLFPERRWLSVSETLPHDDGKQNFSSPSSKFSVRELPGAAKNVRPIPCYTEKEALSYTTQVFTGEEYL